MFYDNVGKPAWIVFFLKSPIDFSVLVQNIECVVTNEIFYLKILALVPSMGNFRKKTVQSGFPTQSQNTRSGVRTIWDLVAAVPTLIINLS